MKNVEKAFFTCKTELVMVRAKQVKPLDNGLAILDLVASLTIEFMSTAPRLVVNDNNTHLHGFCAPYKSTYP